MDMVIKFFKDNELLWAWIGFYIYLGIGFGSVIAIIYYWVIDVKKYVNKIGH